VLRHVAPFPMLRVWWYLFATQERLWHEEAVTTCVPDDLERRPQERPDALGPTPEQGYFDRHQLGFFRDPDPLNVF
jgi:hypothetical protein